MIRILTATAAIFGYCVAYDGPFPSGDRKLVDIDAVFMQSEIGKFDLRIEPAAIELLEWQQVELPQSYRVTGQYPNPF